MVGGSEGSLLSPACSVRVGSTVPRTVFTTHPVRLPFHSGLPKTKAPNRVLLFLVDPRGIEAYTRPEVDFPVFYEENRGFCPIFFDFLPFSRLSFSSYIRTHVRDFHLQTHLERVECEVLFSVVY